MDVWAVGLVLLFGIGFLVTAYYGFRRMRADDERRLSGGNAPDFSSFERDKERAEVTEAERRIGGSDIPQPPI